MAFLMTYVPDVRTSEHLLLCSPDILRSPVCFSSDTSFLTLTSLTHLLGTEGPPQTTKCCPAKFISMSQATYLGFSRDTPHLYSSCWERQPLKVAVRWHWTTVSLLCMGFS